MSLREQCSSIVSASSSCLICPDFPRCPVTWKCMPNESLLLLSWVRSACFITATDSKPGQLWQPGTLLPVLLSGPHPPPCPTPPNSHLQPRSLALTQRCHPPWSEAASRALNRIKAMLSQISVRPVTNINLSLFLSAHSLVYFVIVNKLFD